jgi:DNA mismatch repair protein MutS2
MMDEHSLACLDFARVRALVARYAQSSLGRSLAETIQPIARLELLQRWQNQVNELAEFALDHGLPPYGGVTDVRETVRQCAPPLRVSVEQLAAVRDTLQATHAVGRYLEKLPSAAEELNRLRERIGDFGSIAERLSQVIDERGQIHDHASPKLARLRREIAEADVAITHAVDKLLHDPGVRRLLQYPNPTFHNDRRVLPVRAEFRGRLPGIIHRTSDSGATIYVEPSAAVELNNQIANLHGEEAEEINRILWELAHEVYLNAEQISKTIDALAVLDLVAAKVKFAKAFELHAPTLTDDARFEVREARHPLLLEMKLAEGRSLAEVQREIVPINYRLGEDFDLLVITGPNTGGKTVTLKTVGLLTLMVQAGLPVPVAAGSTMGLVTNVLIDIGDEQSMQQSLSTFSAHMRRLLEMIRRSGGKTLVLIDELGAGTDPDEGGAIGRAILDELLRLKCRCIATTHLGALKSFALTRERAENGCVEFDTETLRPTYHLRIGEAGASNAIEIAQKLGMPKRLINAARQNLSHRARALRSALAGASSAKRDAEKARERALEAQNEAVRRQAEAERREKHLAEQQAAFSQWAQRVAHLQPGDAVRVRDFDRDGKILRLRLDLQRAEVDVGPFAVEVPLGDLLPPEAPAPPPKPKPAPPAAAERATRKHKPTKRSPQKGGSAPATPSTPPPLPTTPTRPPLSTKRAAELMPGDRVYALRFQREGTVVRTKVDKQVAVVSLGLLEVEVPFSGLAAGYGEAVTSGAKRGKSGNSSSRSGTPAGREPGDNAADSSDASSGESEPQ